MRGGAEAARVRRLTSAAFHVCADQWRGGRGFYALDRPVPRAGPISSCRWTSCRRTTWRTTGATAPLRAWGMMLCRCLLWDRFRHDRLPGGCAPQVAKECGNVASVDGAQVRGWSQAPATPPSFAPPHGPSWSCFLSGLCAGTGCCMQSEGAHERSATAGNRGRSAGGACCAGNSSFPCKMRLRVTAHHRT